MTEWVDLVEDEIECLGNHDSPQITNPTILKDSPPSGAAGGCKCRQRPKWGFSPSGFFALGRVLHAWEDAGKDLHLQEGEFSPRRIRVCNRL